LFFCFLFGSFNGLFYAQERKRKREWQTPLHAREKEKKKARKGALKLVWSRFSPSFFIVGSPRILALLVGS
jgi:hypothetical protein